ncbi:Aminopeptidase N [Harpegnathos saltator]|uniref:Aminopeptidase N n=1 Tax=Harpegnathos saltator TaxID=610380 RepID=E2C138_HARSA|nr:Aminopeptidase N [Harpegnathos saltator]
MFEADSGEYIFPCWKKEVISKATLKISVEYLRTYHVISNIPEENIVRGGKDTLQKIFKPISIMPVDLLAIAVIKWNESFELQYNVWFRQEGTNKTGFFVKTVIDVADEFLIGYMQRHLITSNIVILSDIPRNTVGTGQLVLLRESDLVYKGNVQFPGHKLEIWKTIAYGKTEQYIQSFINLDHWSHMWFSKALTLYLSYNILEKNVNFKDVMMNLFVVQVQLPAMHNDIALNVPSITDPYDPIYSIFIYKKASVLLKMLEQIVSKEVFQKAVALFINTYAYQTRTPNDFFSILSKLKKIPGDMITNIMSIWLSQRYYPIVIIRQDGKKYHITYNEIQHKHNDSFKRSIPVTYATKKDPQFNQYALIYWLNNNYTEWNSDLVLTLDNEEDWVILDVQYFGYYRVRYDNANWLKIAHFLKKDNGKTIPALNRAQLIDDAYYFLMMGKMDYKFYYEIIDFLRNETDFIVWHSMMNVLHYMSPFFKFEESQRFKKLIMDIMSDVLMELGYYEKVIDEDALKATRLILVNWMCNHGNDKCRKAASDKLRAYFKEADESLILWGWKNWVYCSGLMNSDREIRMLTNSKIWNGTDENILQYITCYDDDNSIQDLLTWIAFKPRDITSPFDDEQEEDLYRVIVKKHARKSEILDFILKNMIQLSPGNMSLLEKLGHVIMSVHSKCQLQKMSGVRIGVVFLTLSIYAAPIFSSEFNTPLGPNLCYFEPLIRNLLSAVQPNYYSIFLTTGELSFQGKVRILFELIRETYSLIFHAKYLEIVNNSVILWQHDRTLRDIDQPIGIYYCNETSTVIVKFKEILCPGTYNIIMSYRGFTNKTKAFYQIKEEKRESNETWSYVMLLEPESARYVFPCRDELTYKATFYIIIQHLPIYHVYSNMQKRGVIRINKTTSRTAFLPTPVMRINLLRIALIKFNKLLLLKNDVWYGQEGTNETDPVIKNITNVINDFLWLYMQKRLETSIIVVFSDLLGNTVGARQLIFLRESDLVYKNDIHYPGRIIDIWKTIAYRKAEQYIQSFIHPNHWSHTWFHKALALYLSYNILGQGFDKERMMQLFVVQVQLPAMHNDIVLKVPSILRTDDPIYSTLIYKKEWNSYLELTLDNVEEWVILNVQYFGYYRVRYDNTNWLKIAYFLKEDNGKTISVLNRAQLIDDAYHFVMMGTMDYKFYYELIDFLRNETDFIVWHSMMNVLHYMSPFFKFPESEGFKNFIIDIMNDALTQIGYDEKPTDDNMLKSTRLLLLNWMCNHGNDKCRQSASDKLKAYLKNANELLILPGWRNWVFCAGLMKPDYEVRTLVKHKILHEMGENIVQYMTCYDDDDSIQELLTSVMFKSSDNIFPMATPLNDVQKKYLYRIIVKKHARKSKVLDSILKDMIHLLPGSMSLLEKLGHVIMSVHSRCQMHKVLRTRFGVVFVTLSIYTGLIFPSEFDTPNKTSKCYNTSFTRHLLSTIVSQYYNVWLRIEESYFEGKVTISFELLEKTEIIAFYVSYLEIDLQSIVLSQYNPNSAEVEQPKDIYHCKATNTVTLLFDELICPEYYNITMRYRGSPYEKNGFHRIKQEKEKDNVTYRVFSNIVEEKYERVGEDTIQTIFKPAPVISTDLLTIAVIKLDELSESQYNVWFGQEGTNKTDSLVKSVIYVADEFLTQYTQTRLEVSIIVIFSDVLRNTIGARQLVFLREGDLIYDRNIQFAGRILEIWKTIAYAKAEQYIQSFINLNNWSDVCFSKALALYLSYNILGYQSFNSKKMMELFVVQVQLPAMHNDIALKVPSITDPYDPIYSIFVYKKDIMSIWLSQRYYPIVIIVQNPYTKTYYVYNEIKRDFHNSIKWPVPLTYATKKDPQFSQYALIYWMNYNYTKWNSYLELTLDNVEDWIILNVQYFGYYRVRYDNSNWLKIAHFLKEDYGKTIPVLNRVQLIDDAYHFVMMGTIDYKFYYEIIDFLRNETDFIVWHSMMNVLHYTSPFFKFPESEGFKDFIMDIMNDALTQIGYDEKPTDDNMLKSTRLLLLNWMCNHGNDKCKQSASDKLRAYVKYAKESLILPGWKNWVYCAGVMKPDRELRRLIRNKMLCEIDENVVQYLSCYDDDNSIQNLLTLVKSDNIMSPLDYVQEENLYRAVVKKHARKSKILDFLLETMVHLSPGNMTLLEKLGHVIMSVYSKCQLEKMIETRIGVALLSLLLNIGIISVVATDINTRQWGYCTLYPHEIEPYIYLVDNIIPQIYHIKLKIYQSGFDGDITIEIAISAAVQEIRLHVHNLYIEKDTITLIEQKDLNQGYMIGTLKAYSYCGDAQILILKFDSYVRPGLYKLSMKYRGVLMEERLGFVQTVHEVVQNKKKMSKWSYITDFEPYKARLIFPCWDVPSYKTPFNISIEHQQDIQVFSNMPHKRNIILSNMNMLTIFELTPPMSTYQVTMAIIPSDNKYSLEDIWFSSTMTSETFELVEDIIDATETFLIYYTENLWQRFIVKIIGYPHLPMKSTGSMGLAVFRQHVLSIPITYAVYTPEYSSLYMNNSELLWLNDNSSVEITHINQNQWILLNIQQFGYYRVNYDNQDWLRIASFLNNSNYKQIHVLNRAQILDDAYYFLMENNMNYHTYYCLIAYLRKETSFIVWHTMMNVLHYMSSFFKFAQSFNFKKYMLRIMDELIITEVGYYEKNTHNLRKNVMRLLLLNWSCKHGSDRCRQEANNMLAKHIEDPVKYPILPWWKDWVYCAGLMKTNNTIWNRVQNNIKHGNNLDMLYNLACNDNNDMITNLLTADIFKTDNEWLYLNNEQQRKLYQAILKKHARKDKILDFILKNFDYIPSSELSNKLGNVDKLVEIIMNVYSKYQLDKMTARRINVVLFLTVLFKADSVFTVPIYTKIVPLEICKHDALNYSLPDAVVPRTYEIWLMPIDDKFHGVTNIIVEVIRMTSSVIFHAENLTIDLQKISFKSEVMMNTKIVPKLMGYEHCREMQTVSLLFEVEIPPGYYMLHVEYMGRIEDSLGLIRMRSRKKSYVTILEPTGARRVFPCWDEPKFKAIFKISVIHWPGQYVFSNMPYDNSMQLNHGRKLTEFSPTPPMPTYLMTIVILDSGYGNLTEDRVWFSEQITEEMSNSVRQIAMHSDRFLMRYTEKFGENSTTHVVVFPELPKQITGGWDYVIFRHSDLLYEQGVDFPGRLIDVWRAVAHGMARKYIESLVSPTKWSHLWFSRALELYLSYNIVGENLNEERMMQLFIIQVLQPVLHNNVVLKMPSVLQEHDPIYSTLIYRKASVIIKMLEHIVTKKVMQQAIAEYLNKYAYGSAAPDDFFEIVDRLTHRLKEIPQYNVTDIVHTWLSQSEYPTLLVTQNYTTNSTIISFNDRGRSPGEQVKWLIPITYVKQKCPNCIQEVPKLWLNKNKTLWNNSYIKYFNEKDWILLHVQQFGYYRVNYDNESWLRIALFLNDDDYKQIHVLNRAQILDDAYHFLMEGNLHMLTYMSLIQYLSKETDFIVWHSMMNVLQYMSPFFKFPESKNFKSDMIGIMTNVLSKIGYDEHPNDDDMLRATRLLLLNWACKHGSKKCREMANYKLRVHLAYSKKYPVLLWWKEWTFCAGLMNTTSEIWDKIQRDISYGYRLETIKYLPCNDNEDMLKELLASITFRFQRKWTHLGGPQLRNLYHTIVEKHSRKSNMLDFILEKFSIIDLGIHGYSEPNDFFNILYRMTYQYTDIPQRNITKALLVWLSQKYYPTLMIKQRSILESKMNWPILVTYATQREPDFHQNIRRLWLNNTLLQLQNNNISLQHCKEDEWFIINVQQFVLETDHRKIHALNRAQLIDDGYHFVMENKMNRSNYIHLLQYMKNEVDFIVWHSMINVLQYMSPFFNYPESQEFKNVMVDIMSHVLKTIGYDEDPKDDDMTKAMRSLLQHWSCKLGCLECRDWANKKLMARINDKDKYPLWWQGWIACAGMMSISYEDWYTLMHYTPDSMKLGKNLACNQDVYMILIYFKYVIFGDKFQWSQAQIAQMEELYHAIVKNHARQKKMFDSILESVNETFPYLLGRNDKLVEIMMNVYSKCPLHKKHLYSQMTNLYVVQVLQPALYNDISLKVPHIKSIYDPFYSSLIENKELNFLDTLPRMWIRKGVTTPSRIDSNDWIIFNIQQSGFYRVNYEYDNWMKIVLYLCKNNHKDIHRLNRAQLIDDAYHFMMTQEVSHDVFLKLIDYLSKEQDYVPWPSMINVLHYTSSFFNFAESKNFKNYVLNILSRHLITFKYNTLADEATSILIMNWACKLGHFVCKQKAYQTLIQYLENPTKDL